MPVSREHCKSRETRDKKNPQNALDASTRPADTKPERNAQQKLVSFWWSSYTYVLRKNCVERHVYVLPRQAEGTQSQNLSPEHTMFRHFHPIILPSDNNKSS